MVKDHSFGCYTYIFIKLCTQNRQGALIGKMIKYWCFFKTFYFTSNNIGNAVKYKLASWFISKELCICTIEWKQSFCALNSFKIGCMGVTSNIPFFWEICEVNLSLKIFSQVGQVCGKQHSFYPPIVLDFPKAIESTLMINILKINCGVLPEIVKIHLFTKTDGATIFYDFLGMGTSLPYILGLSLVQFRFFLQKGVLYNEKSWVCV